MAKRQIVGLVKTLEDDVYADATILFSITRSNFDGVAMHPSKVVSVVTDGLGQLPVDFDLWTFDDALKAACYVCRLPDGEKFKFDLYKADLSPINFSVLRAVGCPPRVIPPDIISIVELVFNDYAITNEFITLVTNVIAEDYYDIDEIDASIANFITLADLNVHIGTTPPINTAKAWVDTN